MPAWLRLRQGTPKPHASCSLRLLQTLDSRTPRSACCLLLAIHRFAHALTGNTDINALPGTVPREKHHLPVFLHPLDGFIPVELLFEFIFL